MRAKDAALFGRRHQALYALSKSFVDERFELYPAPFSQAPERHSNILFQSDRSAHASKHIHLMH